jgi:hypothetical protein
MDLVHPAGTDPGGDFVDAGASTVGESKATFVISRVEQPRGQDGDSNSFRGDPIGVILRATHLDPGRTGDM